MKNVFCILFLLVIFCGPALAAGPDLNGDNKVTFADLAALAGRWLDDCNQANAWCSSCDINRDGSVNMRDYGILVNSWLLDGGPYPIDEYTSLYQKAASYIYTKAGEANRGYCFVFGAAKGRLGYELSRLSGAKVFGLDSNSVDIAQGQGLLENADLYGDKLSLYAGSLTSLPFRNYGAMLVVCDSIIKTGLCPGSASEMFRMIRPDGGIGIIGQPAGCPIQLTRPALETWLNAGNPSASQITYTITEDGNGLWAHLTRAALPGAGEWTHVNGDAGNTACSGDTRSSNTNKMLWVGEPGPQIMPDRAVKSSQPLYKNGRLIIPAEELLICADAYNGAKLWSLPFPNSPRMVIRRDGGGMAMDANYLYAVRARECWKIDVKTGQHVATFYTPNAGMEWGYVGLAGDALIGTEQVVGASHANDSADTSGDYKPIIVSKRLFCLDANTGALRWTYDNASAIANAGVCAGSKPSATYSIYLLESKEPSAVNDADGRVTPATFTSGDNEYLVKVNISTGAAAWRVQHNMYFEHIIYLSYSNGKILASGAYTSPANGNYWYQYYAFSLTDGSLAWEKTFDTLKSASVEYNQGHGTQDKHPMIVGNTICLKFGSYSLSTGASTSFTYYSGNCADSSASMNHIYTRAEQTVRCTNIASKTTYTFATATRPGCHINVLPAGGVILMPVYSAGCTCDFTIQASECWLPQ